MPVDKFGRMSDTKTRDTGVSLTYINNNYVRSDGSTPVTGSIDMKGNTLTNVSDPVNPQDVATKEYADKVGGAETAIIKTRYGNYGAIGNIDMRGFTLTNVLDPVDAQDVATKNYVDKRPYIITVPTDYCGDLIKDEYQFTFRGNKCKHRGVLMPLSGRIKWIKVKIVGGVFGEIEGERGLFVGVDEKTAFGFEGQYLFGDLFSVILFKGGIIPNKPNINPIGSLFEDNFYIPELYPPGSILSTYKCKFSEIERKRVCNFNFSHDLKNYPLSEGDIFNIKTEKDFKPQNEMTYLFTFLIELDPL